MRLIRRSRALGLSLTLIAMTAAGASTPAPQIAKPRPDMSEPKMAPLAPAVIDNSLLIGGDDVGARAAETRMTVAVMVNGRGPYNFVVDSGADTSVVGLNIARDLQLPLGRPAILNDMTARNVVDRVKVAQLTLGPSTISDLEVPALREADLGGHGMIGIDALVRQRLMMDFEERVIKVEDARKPARRLPGEIIVIGRLNKGQLILTEVDAGGLPLQAVVDTGSEITIGNTALRDKLVRRSKKDWVVGATGVTGKTIDLQLARIRHLKIGSVVLRDVPIAFADLPPFKVFGLNKEPALLLGTDILETFRRVSLDFRARKARFQLRKCGSQIVSISNSPTSAATRLTSASLDVCQR
ncbi:aspartyl protease family protein [Sphingomonas lutea]|uniref:Aspartyl protease family protein n=1 Tax=Sphingomonas lutea TaxID=1045317 RepID=A0A7G9SID1_9SPHN|nr:retroviral-like aspartic protease family protein [Sphingomonas lutea]QNN67606.1 aspartyl protease family protein [Sphingomonas lutea]